jgi:hypothetical protein
LRAALFVCGVASPIAAQDLLTVEARDGAVLGQLAFEPAREICLSWSHSVTGGAVADCFENRAGALTLTRSYLHDFAAGLGEIAGRGTLVSAQGGGYWIEGIDEAIPDNALLLRVGAIRVGHVLRGTDTEIDLSAMAAGQRVTLRLIPHTP